MDLNYRTYELSVQANLQGQDVKVKLNGKDTEIKLKHIFKGHWFETGKIVGYSILEYYTVKDGLLEDKEGNTICFSCERFPEIKINRIKAPVIDYSEEQISLEVVRDICALLNIEKPEELLKALSVEDKKAIVETREAKLAELETKRLEQEAEEARLKAIEEEKLAEEARLAEEEAKTAAEKKKAEEETRLAEEAAAKAEQEKIEAEKQAEIAKKEQEEAEAAAKKAEEAAAEAARIEEEKRRKEEEQYCLNEKMYEKTKRKYERMGMKEFIKGNYHFFYGTNLPSNETPFILAKRNSDKYEELEGGIVSENAEEVEFEFTDGEKDKTLMLDIENDDVVIQ